MLPGRFRFLLSQIADDVRKGAAPDLCWKSRVILSEIIFDQQPGSAVSLATYRDCSERKFFPSTMRPAPAQTGRCAAFKLCQRSTLQQRGVTLVTDASRMRI